MKVAWSTVLEDMDGKPIVEGRDADGKDRVLTLGRVAINSLSALSQADQQLSGEEKFKLGALANKIHTEPDAEYEVEEIAKVKDKIGKLYAPYLVFKTYSLLK
jgi:hypothetical protein